MSDAALRELERAAQAGGAADWTRLARAQARAGQDGARAAVQALLRDPAAPVRELLVAGRTPGPRALAGPTLARLLLPGDIEPGTVDLVDLGQGRALLDSPRELVAVDLFGGVEVWRRPRRPPHVAAVVVGRHVAELGVEGERADLRWFDAATGAEAGSLAVPGALIEDPGHVLFEPLVGLGGSRCAALVPGSEGSVLAFVDLERSTVTRTVTLPAEADEDAPSALFGAEGLACTSASEQLHTWAAHGAPRWSVPVPRGGAAAPLAVDGERLVVRLTAPWTPPYSGGGALWVLDLRDGVQRRTIDCEDWWGVHVASGLVVVASRRDATLALSAHSISDTRVVWSVELPGASSASAGVGLRTAGDLLLVEDRRHVAAARRPRTRPAATIALDLATGATLWTRPAPDDESLVACVAGLLLTLGPPAKGATQLRRYGPA